VVLVEKVFDKLYSIPEAVIAEQPTVYDPANEAPVEVIDELAPVVVTTGVFIPVAVVGTLTAVLNPPPEIATDPLNVPVAVGINLTQTT